MMIPTAVVAAQYAGMFEYFETSRIDARANQPPPVVQPSPSVPQQDKIALAADASLSPVARLRVTDRRWEYTLSYSPTFTVTDIELPISAKPVVLNAGAVSAAWHDRRVRVMLSEAGSYGWENLAYLYGTPVAGQPLAAGQSQAPGQTVGQMGQATAPTSGQTLGVTGTAPIKPTYLFPFGSSTTTASMQLRATRSVTVALSGGYSLSGNLSNSTEGALVYPEQFGPSGYASVAYASSPIDSFITLASAQEITTPMGVCLTPAGQILAASAGAATPTCRNVAPLLLLEETARHRLSSNATLSAGLGVSASVYQLTSEEVWGVLPVGGVALTERFGPPPQGRDQLEPSGVRLSADLSPTVNIFTGTPSNRLQISASLVTHVARNVVLSFVAGALQTVPLPRPDPSPLTLLNGGVDARVRLTSLISVSAGVQALWETQQNVGVLPLAASATPTGTTTTEVGYVALIVRAPRLRF